MKLLRLTIHNIASIENAVIDFEKGPLADDTRFLICGPLGSGKTTILDAICLALYNTTPRLSNAASESYTDMRDAFKTARDDGSVNIDDSRMLMRRGSVKAYAELVFTDRNDNVLTAMWSCSKAREKADGKIQVVRWTLSDASGNEISSKRSETEKEIAARIGLTFEQFSRTTMLAQGEFTRFLKARDSDKSEILEKLTGTEIYSHISISIQKTMSAKKEIHTRKEAEMKGIVLMPDEIRIKTEAGIAENIKAQAELSAREAGLKEIVGMSEKTAELTAELSGCTKSKATLLNEFLRLSAGLEFLREYVIRQESIAGEAEAFIGREKPMEGIYSDIGRLKVLLANAANAGKERRRRLDEAEKAGIEAEKLEAETVTLAEKLAEAVRADTETGRKLEDIRKILADTDMASLMKQKEAAGTELLEAKEYSELRRNCIKAGENHTKLSEQAAGDRLRLESMEKEAAGQEKALIEAAEAYRLQEKIYEAKKTACDDILKEIRSRLQQGDTCPLCGQHIAHLTRDEEFESVLEPERKKKDELREACDRARHKADKTSAAIAELEKTLKVSLQLAEKAGKEYGDLKMKLTAHPVHALRAGTENTDEALERLCSDREKVIKSLSDRIQDIIATQKIADDFQIRKNRSYDAVQKAKEEAEKLGRRIEEKKAGKTLLLQTAERLEGEYMANIAAADTVLSVMPDWRKDWETAPETFMGNMEKAAAKYTAECEKIKQIRSNLSLTDSVRQTVERCREQTLALYPEWLDCATPEPSRAEGLQEKWNALFADAKSLYDHKKRTEGELSDLRVKTEAKGIRDIAAAADEAKAELAVIQDDYRKCSMEIGAGKEKIDNDRKLRERLGKLAEEAGKAKDEYLQWHRLYELFGSSDGKKFRNIAQSYVLRQLLAGANVYLRKLTDRYELAGQPGSLTILLKDKEAGGVLRPTSTISGGESFLTSLALALGLSSLSNRSASMDILFIDEGFGTLDSTYLGTVMDALEQLHQIGGRKIGIISHVESLKERLTTQVQVLRVNSTLSRIEVKSIL